MSACYLTCCGVWVDGDEHDVSYKDGKAYCTRCFMENGLEDEEMNLKERIKQALSLRPLLNQDAYVMQLTYQVFIDERVLQKAPRNAALAALRSMRQEITARLDEMEQHIAAIEDGR